MYKTLLIILCCSIFKTPLYSQPLAKASRGVLDLRGHNWSTENITDLNGEWTFYAEQLYTPEDFSQQHEIKEPAFLTIPGFWNDAITHKITNKGSGFGTYRLIVLCPDSREALALKMLTISTAYRMFVNGKEVARAGTVGTSAATSVAEYKPQITELFPVNNMLDIIVQVSNYDYRGGGIWDVIKLGTAEKIKQYYTGNLSRDFFVTGSFLMIGLYHLIVFFFFRRRFSPLYLGLVSIAIATRVVSTGEIVLNTFVNMPFHIIIRFEFISMFLITTFLVLFVYQLFSDEFPKTILKFLITSSLLFTVTGLLAPPLVVSYCTRPFEIIMIFAACYGLYISIKALQHKKKEAIFFLAAFILLFISLINDILHTSLIIETGHYFYAGLFVFVLLQAVSLSKQFSGIFFMLDDTNRKLQRSNEELTKLNKELDSFVYRVSHDLRAPVTSVMGLINVAENEPDPEKLKDYFAMQRKTLSRLERIITDIIDYSKNNRIVHVAEKINLKELIGNVIEDHNYLNNVVHIEKIIEIQEEAFFVSDTRRIYILLNNLVSNAIKYSSNKTQLPVIKIEAVITPAHATIKVSDNGRGIDTVHLDKIFGMFYRANNDTQGTGLGLYIAKEVVDKLNGSIDVYSELNKGTTFTVVIPNQLSAAAI